MPALIHLQIVVSVGYGEFYGPVFMEPLIPEICKDAAHTAIAGIYESIFRHVNPQQDSHLQTAHALPATPASHQKFTVECKEPALKRDFAPCVGAFTPLQRLQPGIKYGCAELFNCNQL